MIKNWREDIATENYKLYKENRNARRAWEIDAIRFDDFRYGQHFSRAEEKEMLTFRQAPLPISITTAICDTAEAFMTAAKPTIRVSPIIHPFDENLNQLSKNVAQRYQYLIQKDWYDSLGGLQYDRVTRDYTNVGHGFFYVTPKQEFGEFKTEIKHLGWRYVYPHSMTKDPFYRDADNTVIAMRVSEKYAYKWVKAFEKDLTWDDFEEGWIKGAIKATAGTEIPTRYSPHSIKAQGLIFIKRIVLEEHKSYVIVAKTEDAINEVRFVPELTDALKERAKAGEITVRETTSFFLTEYTSVGNRGYRQVYPITQYNLVPLVYDHRDTPYPLGRIWYLYPLQRALNKFIMVAMLNGSLMNALRVIAEDNTIVDEHEWKKNFATPGALLKWKQAVPGFTKEPQIVQPQPLGEAWLAMPKYLTYIMEYVSGIFGTMMGDSRESPDVFSTVASLQSAGGMKIKRRLAQADAALSIVGKVSGEFYKEYAPLNGYSTQIDDNGEEAEPVLYNVVRPKKDDSNDIEITPETDLSRGFKTVRFTTQPSQGFEAGTEAALLTNLATQLKVPALVPLILKRLNIADVDKIMDSVDSVAQKDAAIDEMGKTIKELDGRTKALANQLTGKSLELSKAQFDTWFAAKKGQIINEEEGKDNGR